MNKNFAALMLAGSSVLALASPALAQEDDGEIVVTGTFIRGIAPAGGQSIGLGTTEIAATGATNTGELLATVPQMGDFNGLPSVISTGSALQQAVNRPAIRGLTSGGAGGSPTLILMDGHRLAGAGILQTVADPDVVPPGVIQRVEIVTDGGSSIYGADAVGGVINFITRDDFDGVEFNIRQGFGDEVESTDAYVTAGTNWAGGSAYLSYNYAQHDAIYGRDRDYVRRITYDPSDPLVGLPIGRSCAQPNLTVGGQDYAIDTSSGTPTFTPAAAADIRCDLTDDITIYPQERRDSLFGGFSQDLTSNLSFDLRAWYTQRITKNDRGPNYGSGADNTRVITPANAFYVDVPGFAGQPQTVYYDYSSIDGLERMARVELETWGISPSLTWDIGNDWQARGFLNYGHSTTNTRDPGIDSTALVANLNSINFYDIGSTDAAILQQLVTGDIELASAEDEIFNGRLVFDGPLFALFGADEIRAAVGVEYLAEEYDVVTNGNADQQSRQSRSLFGELNVPVVSPEHNIPLVHSVNVSLSARYDSYSDFGEVATPRIGITYEPLDWVRLRGNWGKSFQAPSLADTAQTGTTVGSGTPTSVLQFALPFTVPNPTTDVLMTIGGAAPLEAQRADTYSIGIDISPPIIENLELSATYYNIEFTGQIGSPPVWLPTFYTSADTQQFFVINQANPGAPIAEADLRAFLASRGVDAAEIDEAINDISPGNNVTLANDFRRVNLGSVRVDGIDASVRYTHDTSFGSIYFNASGTYRLTNQVAVTGTNYAPNDAGTIIGQPRWGASATLGALVGDNFRAQAQLVHSAGQRIAPNAANAFQDEIDAFDVVNLFFQYDMEGEGWRDDLSLSLGINNVFDDDPASLNGETFNTHGYVGGNIGRIIQIGINKRF